MDQCEVTVIPGDQAVLRYHLPMRNLIVVATAISALVLLFSIMGGQKAAGEAFLVPLLWLWLVGTTYGFLVPRIRPVLQSAASGYSVRNPGNQPVAS